MRPKCQICKEERKSRALHNPRVRSWCNVSSTFIHYHQTFTRKTNVHKRGRTDLYRLVGKTNDANADVK